MQNPPAPPRRTLCGFHAVQARLRAEPESLQEVLYDEQRRDARLTRLLQWCEEARTRHPALRISAVGGARLTQLCGHERHQGIVAFAEPTQTAQYEDWLDTLGADARLLVLDGVTDPRNLGACIRSANALGAAGVIAPRDHAAGLNAAARQTASGAAEITPYYMVPNLARALAGLKERGYFILGFAQEGAEDLWRCKLRTPLALVLGSEDRGLRALTRKLCDALVRIPLQGEVESLNVSVAAGIALAEAARQCAAQDGLGAGV